MILVVVRVVVLLGLAGCNAVFGLEPTAAAPPIDAQYFDAPPDAPYACPAAGAPLFSPYLHQAFVDPACHDYNAARDGSVAVAMCRRPAQLVQGSLVEIPELADPSITYGPPRLTPEGDAMYLVNAAGRVDVFARAGASWTAQSPLVLPFALAVNATIGTPSAGTPRHLMLVNNDSMIHELSIDAAGNATELRVVTANELGVPSTDHAPSFTPDGLHVAFVALDTANQDAMYFASRPSPSALFAHGALIAGVGNVSDPFITADCGRLYFSTVGSVVYVQQ